jgi:CYTH domain-containing protein
MDRGGCGGKKHRKNYHCEESHKEITFHVEKLLLNADFLTNFAAIMAKEIERKFLVAQPAAMLAASTGSKRITQGYLSVNPDATVRVRLINSERGFLTVKGRNHGAVRSEWEYEIPAADARQMLELCADTVIDKTRHLVPAADGLTWEVDEFHSPHAGLFLAEVELPAADHPVALPAWLGEEVTSNPAYYNSTLATDKQR